MTATEGFVFAVAEIGKGRVPENFYEVRERLNVVADGYENAGRLTTAITDATLEVCYLNKLAGESPLHIGLARSRKKENPVS